MGVASPDTIGLVDVMGASAHDLVERRPAGGRSDDDRALSELYLRYSAWLAAMLRRRGGGDGVEDIVQETYLRISRYPAEALSRFPQALLLKVAQNLTRNAATKDANRRAVASAAGQLDEHHVQAAAVQFESVLFEQIIALMPRLPREVFVLSRFRGLNNEEVADTLGISVKSVERRMTQALLFCDARMRD